MISEPSAPDLLFQGAFLEYWEARPLSYNPNPNTERTNAPCVCSQAAFGDHLLHLALGHEHSTDLGGPQALWAPQPIWMIPGSLIPLTHADLYPGVTNDVGALGLPENPGPSSAMHSYLLYPQNRRSLGHPIAL